MRTRLSLQLMLLLVGFALTQLAWIWCLAPFGSMDEIDHAFRISSVAEGHVVDRTPVRIGSRGDIIVVPDHIVEAAHHRCIRLRYVGRDNCFPRGAPDPHGDVRIASAAARYDPVYYLLVGSVAKPFRGVAALYAMRVATALLCDVFIGLALWNSLRHGRGLWPTLGILIGSTPVLLCATSTAAPNGVGMCAALAAWSAVAAILSSCGRSRAVPGLLRVASASSATMMVTHTTGLLWVGVGAVIVSVMARDGTYRNLRTIYRRELAANSILLGVAAGFTIMWTVTQRTNDPIAEAAADVRLPMGKLFLQPIVWALQTIGAAPFRDQPGPSVVFVLGLALFGFIVAKGLRRASRSVRAAALALAVASLVVPIAATALTYSRLGFAWQGRYELPLGYGILLLAAWSVGEPHRRLANFVSPALVVGSTAVMQVATLVYLRVSSMHWSGLDGGSPPPVPALVLLVVLATVLWAFALRPAAMRHRQTVPVAEMELCSA